MAFDWSIDPYIYMLIRSVTAITFCCSTLISPSLFTPSTHPASNVACLVTDVCVSFAGGTLKIYGESLCRDVPYKTLLLSIRDCAQAVVREMLAKYGLDKTDPLHYCLVQVSTTTKAVVCRAFVACLYSINPFGNIPLSILCYR